VVASHHPAPRHTGPGQTQVQDRDNLLPGVRVGGWVVRVRVGVQVVVQGVHQAGVRDGIPILRVHTEDARFLAAARVEQPEGLEVLENPMQQLMGVQSLVRAPEKQLWGRRKVQSLTSPEMLRAASLTTPLSAALRPAPRMIPRAKVVLSEFLAPRTL
jgi:hypothetical protein